MQKTLPKISNQIDSEDVYNLMLSNFKETSQFWANHQLEWINGAYRSFNDHDKFLIIIYLIKKTLDFYSRNFIKLNYNETYAKDKIEVEKFNVIEISKVLKIPKESARRKIIELEKKGVIQRNSKSIIIDRAAFPYVKPINSVIRTSRFLSKFSNILAKEKVLKHGFKSTELQEKIEQNFSYVWKLYYELQIPMVIGWKGHFRDLCTWHIWGLCAANQINYISKINQNDSLDDFYKEFFSKENGDNRLNGLNAMSISEITGIPRATVVRKLNSLIKTKHLIIDENKRYSPSSHYQNEMSKVHMEVIKNLSVFSSSIFNLSILQDETIEKIETPFYLKPL